MMSSCIGATTRRTLRLIRGIHMNSSFPTRLPRRATPSPAIPAFCPYLIARQPAQVASRIPLRPLRLNSCADDRRLNAGVAWSRCHSASHALRLRSQTSTRNHGRCRRPRTTRTLSAIRRHRAPPEHAVTLGKSTQIALRTPGGTRRQLIVVPRVRVPPSLPEAKPGLGCACRAQSLLSSRMASSVAMSSPEISKSMSAFSRMRSAFVVLGSGTVSFCRA